MMPVFQQLASDAAALNSRYIDACNDMEEEDCVVIELEAADPLANYTLLPCSEGFKRDTNLRMHMRALGDDQDQPDPEKSIQGWQYLEEEEEEEEEVLLVLEGCKWNKNHGKFQPLKSSVCAKNHNKRSHCPKMYGCKRCDHRQFAVLSDLRTQEKHCGDGAVRWRCSCGSTFSRKDKLMGHVDLFADHSPVLNRAG